MSDEAIAQAQQCIHVARTAHAAGDLTKAIRFCQKSLNFHASSVAEALLHQYQEELKHGTKSSATSTGTGVGTRRGSGGKTAAPVQEETKRIYTEEQAAAARGIKKLKDYYDVLGLARDSTDKDIKAAYRKRALQFHPDKNQAPEAEEAFKAVSTAFQTLSDPQKRAYYDEHGEDQDSRAQRQHAQHQQYEREDDLSPEDIFNMFFNVRPGAQGGYTRRTYVYPRQQRRRAGGDGDGGGAPASGLMQFVQFLPLVLLLLFSFLSAPGGEDLPFSLDASTSFPVQRLTRHSDIQYFVNRNFAARYRDPRALAQVETQVEQALFKRVEEECQKQKLEKKSAIASARQSAAHELNERLQKAQSMQTPACTRLQEMHPAHRQGG